MIHPNHILLRCVFRFENVPLIFTEYYKMDCELNLEKVDSLVEPELTVMVEPGENPFCSSLPARELIARSRHL